MRPRLARQNLEAWVLARVPHLSTPILDVGTAKRDRPWLPTPRLTLDQSAGRGADVIGDIEHLDGIADHHFGSVVCTEVLEHVVHPDRAVRELRRVTRPGGTLVVSVPWLYPIHPTPLDLRRFTLQGLTMLLEEAGWKVEEAEGLPIPAEALAHLVEAITILSGRCPNPGSLGFSNWVVRARV